MADMRLASDLKDLDGKGCVSFKSFIGPVSPDYESLNYGQAMEAMDIIKEFGGRAAAAVPCS